MKLLILVLSILLISSCSKNPYNEFMAEISKYESFNKELDFLYYNQFQINRSIIKSLNHVNYPNFLEESSERIYYDDIILVNKLHGVDKNYLPDNLVVVENVPYIKRPTEVMYINKQALYNFRLMVDDAKKEGIDLVLYSAYRSYEKQESLWTTEFSFENMYLAVPGYSEHHTGLALDISTTGDGLTKEKTKAYTYLKDNAHRFGFILRYQEGKEKITGYNFEPWHYRYVGEIATFIHENNLTLEEYIYDYIAI